ncbi:MAG: clostripain-related cysteine peptidase [Acidimicrobiia bacterium]
MRNSWWRTALAGAALATGATLLPAVALTPASTVAAQGSEAEWTVMVYLDADNNLETQGLLDLQEMAAAAGPRTSFVVLIDRAAKDYSDPLFEDGDVVGLPAFSDAKLLHVTASGVDVLQELGEVDLMDPQTLAWFVWYGLTEFPAERNALVMWDHGGGPLIPFGEDEDSNTEGPAWLDTTELQQAIGSGLQSAGVDQLDLLAFDTCLNSTVEIARAVAPYADVLVASEELVNGHGLDYEAFRILEEGDVDAAELGTRLADDFATHAIETPYPLGGEVDYTMSVVDLDAMDGVDAALARLVDAFEANPEAAISLLQARQGAIEFGVVSTEAENNYQFVDLGDVLARLPDSLPSEVLVARNNLYAAVDTAVLHNINGPYHEGARGLAIYLPARAEHYVDLYDEHADPTGWRAFLQELLTQSGPAPSADGLELTTEAEGWRATLALDAGQGGDLAEAFGVFGVPNEDGSVTALALLPATIGAGGADQVQTTWTYQYVLLDDQPVTASIDPMAGGMKAIVEGVYLDPAGKQSGAVLSMELLLGADALEFGDVRLIATDGAAADIVAAAGSRFVPTRLSVDGTDVVDQVLLDPIDANSFAVGIRELDVGLRFAASIVAYQPDGSGLARTAVSTRP